MSNLYKQRNSTYKIKNVGIDYDYYVIDAIAKRVSTKTHQIIRSRKRDTPNHKWCP